MSYAGRNGFTGCPARPAFRAILRYQTSAFPSRRTAPGSVQLNGHDFLAADQSLLFKYGFGGDQYQGLEMPPPLKPPGNAECGEYSVSFKRTESVLAKTRGSVR